MMRQLKNILQKRTYAALFVGSALGAFFLLRALPHLAMFQAFFALPNIPWSRRWEVVSDYTIASLGSATVLEQFIAVLLPLAIALNITVTVAYYRTQAQLFRGRGFLASGAGLFLGLFGVGCFACSSLLLAPLVAALGLSGAAALLPYRGMEIGVVGIVVLLGVSGAMLRKLAHNNVCN